MKTTLKPSRLEVAMRAWALQDARVHDYQQRIDQQRLAYLEEVMYEQIGDQRQATTIARLLYSIYVGSQHIIPPIQGTDLAQMYMETQHMLGLSLGSVFVEERAGRE